MIIEHSNRNHSAACISAEATRQLEVSTAANAAAVRTAEIKFWRAIRDSAVANGQPSAQFGQALRDLGINGT